jgi:hypothetical protein
MFLSEEAAQNSPQLHTIALNLSKFQSKQGDFQICVTSGILRLQPSMLS